MHRGMNGYIRGIKLGMQSCFLLRSSFKRSLAIRWLATNVSGKGLRALAKVRKQKVKDFFCPLDVSKSAGTDLIHADMCREVGKAVPELNEGFGELQGTCKVSK